MTHYVMNNRYNPTSTDVQNAPGSVPRMHVSTLDDLEAELMADDRVRARIGRVPFWLRLAQWRRWLRGVVRR